MATDTKALRQIVEAAKPFNGSPNEWFWIGETMAAQYTPSVAAYFAAAIKHLPALIDELDAARAELERMRSSLCELHEKLDIGARCFPHSPSDIFSALLEMHGLGKDAAKDTQP